MRLNSGKKKAICPVCACSEVVFFVRKNRCDLFRCGKCGLIFVFPIVDEYQNIYQSTYSDEKEELLCAGDAEDWEATDDTYEKYLSILDDFLPEKGKLFDVGSATGQFIDIASKRGWEASGMEISKRAAEGAAKKGLDIIFGNFETWQSEKKFDAVTFWDVLEHFLGPERAIANASKILRPGGILAINAPDAGSILMKIMGKRWHHLNPPSHLHYFNFKNLTKILTRNNFEVVYSGRVGKTFTLRQIFKLLAMWQRVSLWKSIYGFLSRGKWGELKIPINTRDNLFILARKIDTQ
jgi:2-polyprenyl-3-methyl-5-hydroxy-6-metoxy-1,4-benzoquinol methylase